MQLEKCSYGTAMAKLGKPQSSRVLEQTSTKENDEQLANQLSAGQAYDLKQFLGNDDFSKGIV